MDTKTLRNWIHDVAKPRGFRRKNGIYWIKFTDECILFMYFQRANLCHYLNLGVYIRELVPNLTFETFRWDYHLYQRAGSELDSLLDLSYAMEDSSRETLIRDKLNLVIMPQLESMGTIDGIKSNVHAGGINSFSTTTQSSLRRILDLPCTRPRYNYGGAGIIPASGQSTHPATLIMRPHECISFDLYKLDNDTGEIIQVATVSNYDEAESWFKKWFDDITREEAADLLVRFVRGESEHNEFRHFINADLKHDKSIFLVREKLSKIPTIYPAAEGRDEFCCDEGMTQINKLAEFLRTGNAPK